MKILSRTASSSKFVQYIPKEHDTHIYKERSYIERFFNRIKSFLDELLHAMIK